MRSTCTQAAPLTPARTMETQRGLSKLQLLLALVLMAIIAALTLPYLSKVYKHVHNPEITAAELQVDAIKMGLQQYKHDNQHYPSNEQGLLALIIKPSREPVAEHWRTGGYVERLPRDPWGNPYQYRLSEDGQAIDVFSFGVKGPDGGDESDSIVRGTKN